MVKNKCSTRIIWLVKNCEYIDRYEWEWSFWQFSHFSSIKQFRYCTSCRKIWNPTDMERVTVCLSLYMLVNCLSYWLCTWWVSEKCCGVWSCLHERFFRQYRRLSKPPVPNRHVLAGTALVIIKNRFIISTTVNQGL